MDKLTVAVITPYHRETLDVLEKCHNSVLAQTHPCLHILIADGFPYPEIKTWQAHHIILPCTHHDIGSTPRLVGSIHAIGMGLEAIAFLDADNWYSPSHISDLMECQRRTGASFISSGRKLCHLDGTPMGPCPITNPERFIDTSCMLFTKKAFYLLHHWVLMPPYAHLIGDRVMLHHVKSSGLHHHHHPSASVNYRCGKEGLYRQLGLEPPLGAEPRPDYENALRQWEADGNPPLS